MDALRVIVLLLSLAGIVAWVWWAQRNPAYRWYVLAPFLWLIHVAAFHAARILDLHIPIETLNYWSVAIHIHAAIVLALAPLVLIRGGRHV